MSKKSSYSSGSDASDGFYAFLESVARFLLWAGLLATLVGLGFLIYTYAALGNASGSNGLQALQNIDLFRKVLFAGVGALAVSTSFLFWGEETLGVLQLLASAALFFMWMYLPGMVGGTSSEFSRVGAESMKAIRIAGAIGGSIAIFTILMEVMSRMKLRAREGMKAETIKYGKGVKEERDVQNVFMGKCWQLPFCRKFVREKCPIYHARRTCWRERVGCMCEEEVIRNAMEGRVIPKDMVAAAKFIPYNTKLPLEAKAERCRQCVIYNEHQKHKYKLALPMTLIGIGLIYLFLRVPLRDMFVGLLQKTDNAIGKATLREGQNAALQNTSGTMPFFYEFLVICFLLIILAYLLKLMEYLFFRLKV